VGAQVGLHLAVVDDRDDLSRGDHVWGLARRRRGSVYA
jgi:hypothetical protein